MRIYMYLHLFGKTGTPHNYRDDSGDDEDDRVSLVGTDDEDDGYNDGVINNEIHDGLLNRYRNCFSQKFYLSINSFMSLPNTKG